MNISDFQSFLDNYGADDFKRQIEISAPMNEEVFITRLYEEIEAIIKLIESAPKERSVDGEDRLSVELVSNLNSAGYFSIKDPTQGGHVDILVQPKKSRKFKWYGEAKIWNGVKYLNGGMDQLLSRYATGKEPNLGFLVYFKTDNLVHKMKEWKTHLNTRIEVDQSLNQDIDHFSFYTVHNHSAGSKIKIRHFSLNIYWNPT